MLLCGLMIWASVARLLFVSLAFVNLIPVAEQCSSTARIGPHHCGHRTGAVRSSDKHWALLSTARVLWLKHWCQCCHRPQWCTGHCPGSLSSTALWSSHCFCEILIPYVEYSGAVLQALLASALIHGLIWPRISTVNTGLGYRVTVWDTLRKCSKH